jgi:hypothetical protein
MLLMAWAILCCSWIDECYAAGCMVAGMDSVDTVVMVDDDLVVVVVAGDAMICCKVGRFKVYEHANGVPSREGREGTNKEVAWLDCLSASPSRGCIQHECISGSCSHALERRRLVELHNRLYLTI